MTRRFTNWSTEDLLCVYGDPFFAEESRELRRMYDNEVRVWVRKVTQNPELAEEAVSAFWSNVLTRKKSFVPAGPGSGLAWMRTVATNAAKDEVRRHCRHDARKSNEDVETLAAVDAEAEARCSEHEQLELLHRAIVCLPPELQAVLVLTRRGSSECGIGQGLLTQDEVAKLLGCRAGATIHRLLKTTCAELKRLVGVTNQVEEVQ